MKTNQELLKSIEEKIVFGEDGDGFIGFRYPGKYIGLNTKQAFEKILTEALSLYQNHIREETDELKILNPVKDHNSYAEGFDEGYNQALDDVKEII